MLQIVYENQFKRDFKQIVKRGYNVCEFEDLNKLKPLTFIVSGFLTKVILLKNLTYTSDYSYYIVDNVILNVV